MSRSSIGIEYFADKALRRRILDASDGRVTAFDPDENEEIDGMKLVLGNIVSGDNLGVNFINMVCMHVADQHVSLFRKRKKVTQILPP